MSQKKPPLYFMSPGESASGDRTDGGPSALDVRARLALDRRDFLKASGFALAFATGCSRSPLEHAVPLLHADPESVPGTATWYASTCAACTAGCGVLGKSRDGRPIKLEGNDLHPLSRGGLCAVGQASLLELYDSRAARSPIWHGESSDWSTVDAEIGVVLQRAAEQGLPVRLLTGSLHSPSDLAAIERFAAAFTDFRHVMYDPLSSAAMLDAHDAVFGIRTLPRLDFARARVIAGFDADFLGTWISPVEFTAAYGSGRSLEGEAPDLSFHLQAEARLSLTGSNADERVLLHPEETAWALRELAALVADRSDRSPRAAAALRPSGNRPEWIARLADRLWDARGESLVVSGSQSLRAQLLCCLVNELLGNYGATLSLERPSYQRRGDDAALAGLERELEAGAVEVLLIRGVNPVYDLPTGERWKGWLAQTALTVSFARSVDETAGAVGGVCPEPHFLEDWRIAEPVAGHLSVTQPLINSRGNTRAFASSLAAWAGHPATSLEWVCEVWAAQVAPRAGAGVDANWEEAVRRGQIDVEAGAPQLRPFDFAALEGVLAPVARPQPVATTLLLYPKVGMLDGSHAHNAWLQELPDPITKVSWDNYASLAPETADALGVEDGDLVELSAAGVALELPAHLQPGQHPGVVAVALGYGREGTDRFHGVGPDWLEARPTVARGGTVGRRANDWLRWDDGHLRPDGQSVSIRPTGRREPLAFSQTYGDLEVPERFRPAGGERRPMIQETVLPAFLRDRSAGKPHGHHFDGNLWSEYPEGEHHWAMAIDLSACTGCSGCVIACQVENNIPVVGRDEVRRRRDLHWMRIDRYYSHRDDGVDVFHQPMLCHHCDNAPCESVCPVAATVHSEEGLNQQVYNRCVGTRYCANNCPYKVRRFNWFEYPRPDAEERLVLNPDVTVRSRGVMEKCSFCAQRIEGAKIEAAGAGRELEDGDFQTACEQSCPADAIVFGDTTDPESRISKALRSQRHYRIFEELNILPSVGYLRVVRNRDEEEHEPHHA